MRVVISAGPTREAIDPVRFISNRSTGRMGYALAAAAVARGMETVLVSGPVALPPPDGLFRLVRVETAAEMAEAMKREAGEAALIIMCAAVADYRPKVAAAQKMKKKTTELVLELEPTEDILLSLGRRNSFLSGLPPKPILLSSMLWRRCGGRIWTGSPRTGSGFRGRDLSRRPMPLCCMRAPGRNGFFRWIPKTGSRNRFWIL